MIFQRVGKAERDLCCLLKVVYGLYGIRTAFWIETGMVFDGNGWLAWKVYVFYEVIFCYCSEWILCKFCFGSYSAGHNNVSPFQVCSPVSSFRACRVALVCEA